MSNLSLVNTLQGTESFHHLSHGNTLPITAMPFGMNHWSPQSSSDPRWWFRAGDRKLQGIRLTHQPSPWIHDYATFLLMPTTGERHLNPEVWAGAYRPEHSTFKPHRFEATLIRYRTKMMLVPSERGAMLRIEFPQGPTARLILRHGEGRADIRIDARAGLITGSTSVFDDSVPANFAMHYVIQLSRPIDAFGTFEGDANEFNDGAQTIEASKDAGAYLEWQGVDSPIEARMATSFVSPEQARLNLEREVLPFSLEELETQAQTAWSAQLGQIDLEGIDDERRATFYTCLYRTKLFPRAMHEIDAQGERVHYSPFDGAIHPGPMYTDSGFWDTYRTHFPLLCLLDPSRVAEMIEGYLNAYREGGWLPQWASPGYRNCMIGTHSDAVLADAIVRGIHRAGGGFDAQLAYEAIRKNGTVPSTEAKFGRKGLADLRSLGFLTVNHYHGTCATLDFAYDDYCIAQVARYLGKDEDAKQFTQYSQTYRNVFDPSVSFFRGRNEDGSWQNPFDPFTWGGPYVEGGAWQHAFDVPHDPAGLISLYGGETKFIAKLDEMMATPPYFNMGDYWQEIHEMTEMAVADFGQYAHSNQPVHHVLMMYAAAGAPEKMQHWVRRVMNELYGSGPDGLCGDEDNGEMTAWFVLNAIGLFPLCPGNPEWVLTSPIAEKAVVKPVGGASFTVLAKTAGKNNAYVHGIKVNGASHEKLVIDHATLARGATLEFTMSDKAPNAKKWAGSARPTSVSKYEGA